MLEDIWLVRLAATRRVPGLQVFAHVWPHLLDLTPSRASKDPPQTLSKTFLRSLPRIKLPPWTIKTPTLSPLARAATQC